MKGSAPSLPLPLFLPVSPPWQSLFLAIQEGVEYFVDGLNRGGTSSAGVNGNPRDRAKDYLEGGNDSENRKESSRPCSQPWNNLRLSRKHLPRRRFPNRYSLGCVRANKSKQ